MQIANWNVNSIRSRIDRVIDFLQTRDIDILAIQETKCSDAQFPTQAFTDLGYEVAHFGLNQWNGVAIISRVGLTVVSTHFPHQPGFAKDPEKPQPVEARALGALCHGIEIWSLYVPNGREIADRHYEYKLRWLYALRDYVAAELSKDPSRKLLLLGDFNIAPTDQDVWDITEFTGKTHVTEPERAAFQALIETGLTETSPGPGTYTYWDYKKGRFFKDEGMRIDFQLASAALADTSHNERVDVAERDGKGASDHAPVIVSYGV